MYQALFILFSGTLIALRNKAFAKAFEGYTPEDLQDEWLQVNGKEVRKADIPQAKKEKLSGRTRQSQHIKSVERPLSGIQKECFTS